MTSTATYEPDFPAGATVVSAEQWVCANGHKHAPYDGRDEVLYPAWTEADAEGLIP